MRWRLLLLVVFALPAAASAQDNRDPLRFVPPDVQVVAKIDRPDGLVDAFMKMDLVKDALETAGVRDFYDSTNYRRLQQLIGYYEKALNVDRQEMLRGLTGGGVAFAARLEKPGA